MNIYFSGLITTPNVTTHPVSTHQYCEADIENNINKIRNLPENIREQILKIPQYKIFFRGGIPYYKTKGMLFARKLPRVNKKGIYYDPVQDTKAYQMVIEDVEKIASKEYEETMLKKYGTTQVFGGIHQYFGIKSSILYEKYGIYCIHNPMTLNKGLFID